MEAIKNKLNFLLKHNVFSLSELGSVSGLTIQTLSLFKKGKGNPKPATINNIDQSIHRLLEQKRELIDSILIIYKKEKMRKRIDNFEDFYGEDIDLISNKNSANFEEITDD